MEVYKRTRSWPSTVPECSRRVTNFCINLHCTRPKMRSHRNIKTVRVETTCGNLLTIVNTLCEVTVDLRRLPASSWTKCAGGQYYQASYAIGLLFGPELVLKFMSTDNLVLGSANARYT
jgi:hypothetical protein